VVLALLALLAVAGSCWMVLADVAAYDRPPAPAPPAREARPAPTSEPLTIPATPAAPLVVERPPVVERPLVAPPVERPLVAEHADGSMLAALGTVEHDDHSPLRRVGAAVVLLALTLLAAGAVGFGIYRGVSGLK
jgi:hypothetical protein